MKKDQFQCELCENVYTKGWSEEESKAEFAVNFPDEPVEQASVVCDDCYSVIMRHTTKGEA